MAETQEGGVYKVGDQTLNAKGEETKQQKSAQKGNQAGQQNKQAAGASAELQDDAAVQEAYTVKDAPKFLAQVKDRAEVERLAALDTREGTKAAYQARLEDLDAEDEA